MEKELTIKERVEVIRDMREEIMHYDERSWLSLSRLLGVNYPYTNADKILLLSNIKMSHIQNRDIELTSYLLHIRPERCPDNNLIESGFEIGGN